MATDGKYVTVADIRSEGITVAQESDAIVSATILSCESIFESWTQRWFYRRQAFQLVLDGGKHYLPFTIGEWVDQLLIPVPAITITAIEIDGFSRDIDRFINYNRIGAPFDDRFNAKIISKYIEWPDYGLQNIKITGDFGFVENYTTYDTPLEIKEAVRKFVIRKLPFVLKMTNHDRQMFLNESKIIEEQTTGYRYRLQPRRAFKDTDPIGWTGDSEIDEVILKYRWGVGFSAA